MTWIRLDTETPGNYKTLGFRDRLSIPISQAVGHLALIWIWMAEHAWDGQLSDVGNEELERAAVWHGEPGHLALAFRDYFCDDKGEVVGWKERQGKLVEYKRKNAHRRPKHLKVS